MRRWTPGPIVVVVFVAEIIGLWAVAALKYFYDITMDPIDVRLNMLLFTTGAAWWTEWMTKP